MKKIIVVFKTHLDIGFTDMAGQVAENYMKSYLPNAMRMGEAFRGQKEGFIWTTGSWLIRRFLEESPERARLEEAIRRGEVRWHALPCTTHTELMNGALFEYGLGISRELDRRFGLHTVAAKLTDVPGHTRAMLSYLSRAGVSFLHIGVNPASTVPEVPPLFRWRADTGEEVLVMYNSDYGRLTPIGDGGAAVYFAHTGDNRGPQSEEEIRQVYEGLRKQYPDADLCAGTLEDVAQEALRQTGLPVVEEEIGDTWIHGAGSDPRKISGFRGLMRLAGEAGRLSEGERDAVYRRLLLVPEHTWGLDEKSWLGERPLENGFRAEHSLFTKEAFRRARSTPPFRRMEASWQEQREYVEQAARAAGSASEEAERILSEYRREPYRPEGEKVPVPITERAKTIVPFPENAKMPVPFPEQGAWAEAELAGYRVKIDGHGAVRSLKKTGPEGADRELAGPGGLAAFSYEIFSQKEYERFQKKYVVSDEEWAAEDFGKIGMEEAVSEYHEYLPCVEEIFCEGNVLVIRMRLPEEAVEKYGGMRRLETVLRLYEDRMEADLAWWEKEATRVAEGSWLRFDPGSRLLGIEKLGTWIDPSRVVRGGNRRLHAAEGGAAFEGALLETIDAPLLSVGERSLLDFVRELPRMDAGVYVCLHNNVWGTNFPMWYDEDARFRFALRWE